MSRLRLIAGLVLFFLAVTVTADQPDVPGPYRKFFVHYTDRRSLSEKALNTIGLTTSDVGRSFALVAGVYSYPNLPQQERSLAPAEVDLRKLVSYLREVELFDEVVLLRNDAVTDDNLKFFLQSYFPARLRKFPKSRFLFVYSGHGIQDGPRGYLLQASATSFTDKANSISLEVIRTLYEEIVDSAYQSLALINACHSGAFEKRAFGTRRLLPREPGAHAITASTGRELAWHDPRVGPGSIFFEKLFAGLEGRADLQPHQPDGTVGDGIITVPELWAYLSEEVQLATDQRQSPLASDISRNGSAGSFFFLHRARVVRAGSIPPWNPDRAGAIPLGPGPASGHLTDDLGQQALAAQSKGDFAEAIDLSRKACDLGSALGCYSLGRMYYLGQGGLGADPLKSAELLQKACDGGHPLSCATLGALYFEGAAGFLPDPVKAVEFYRRACDVGEGDSCTNLAGMYRSGEGGVPIDPVKAAELYRKACDWGSGRGCTNLGVLLEFGDQGVKAEPSKAVGFFRKACDLGDERGCGNLGHMVQLGLGGLTADPVKAEALFQKACEGEDERGCLSLGAMFEAGQLRPANLAQALTFYLKACELGSARGCALVGYHYQRGQPGLAPDRVKAALYYRRSCDKGEPGGCLALGYLLETTDPPQAVEAYRKACDSDVAPACLSLGLMYELGRGGLTVNLTQALALYERACKENIELACRGVQQVKKKIDSN